MLNDFLKRFFIVVVISFVVNLDCSSGEYSWLLQYKDKSTNSVVWDNSLFMQLLDRTCPDKKVDIIGFKTTLKNSLHETLGGSPDDVLVRSNRYVSLSACRFHSCDEKGFLWVDTKRDSSIAAIYDDYLKCLWVFTKSYSNTNKISAMPKNFKDSLESWMRIKELHPIRVQFIN